MGLLADDPAGPRQFIADVAAAQIQTPELVLDRIAGGLGRAFDLFPGRLVRGLVVVFAVIPYGSGADGYPQDQYQ
jgi:hypothetical protein